MKNESKQNYETKLPKYKRNTFYTYIEIENERGG